jgi:hypothetical protein
MIYNIIYKDISKLFLNEYRCIYEHVSNDFLTI